MTQCVFAYEGAYVQWNGENGRRVLCSFGATQAEEQRERLYRKFAPEFAPARVVIATDGADVARVEEVVLRS